VQHRIIEHAAAAAVALAKDAQAAYEQARNEIEACTSADRTRTSLAAISSATDQRERARREEADVEEGMALLKRLLADVPRLRSMRKQIWSRGVHFRVSFVNADMALKHYEDLQDEWDSRWTDIHWRVQALRGSMDRLAGGFETEEISHYQQRLTALRARLSDLDPPPIPTPDARDAYNSLMKHAADQLHLAGQRLKRIDALSSCEEVEAPEQAAQDAGAEVYLAWLDDYRGTLENGRQCIARLESGETPADAQRRRRLAFIRSHSLRSAAARTTDYHSLAAQQRRAEEAARRREKEEERRRQASEAGDALVRIGERLGEALGRQIGGGGGVRHQPPAAPYPGTYGNGTRPTRAAAPRANWAVYVDDNNHYCGRRLPFFREGEIPYVLQIARDPPRGSTIHILRDGFRSRAEAQRWVCSHHMERGYLNSTVGRIEGALVSLTRC